jgi:hypothetical protein
MSFNLQFPPSKIDYWSERYREDHGEMRRECAAFEAGSRLCRGEGTPKEICDDLYAIGLWKSPMALHLLRRNPPADIIEACRIASEASNEARAVDVLQPLRGVAVSMASAILTTMNKCKFTVIDWRALEAFGNPKKQHRPTIEAYLGYLDECRRLAKEHGVSLRTLDQALWAWSAIAGPNPRRTRTKSHHAYTCAMPGNGPKPSDHG